MKDVNLNLGKNGVTPDFLSEVRSHLLKRKLVRIKVLRSALEETTTKKIAEVIRVKLKCKVSDVRGHVIILERKD